MPGALIPPRGPENSFAKGLLIRYDATGNLDASFGTRGEVVVSLSTGTIPAGGGPVLLQPDGVWCGAHEASNVARHVALIRET